MQDLYSISYHIHVYRTGPKKYNSLNLSFYFLRLWEQSSGNVNLPTTIPVGKRLLKREVTPMSEWESVWQ